MDRDILQMVSVDHDGTIIMIGFPAQHRAQSELERRASICRQGIPVMATARGEGR